MAGRLTPLGALVKWILAPVFVALVGYYLVGPRLVELQRHPIAEKPAESDNP